MFAANCARFTRAFAVTAGLAGVEASTSSDGSSAVAKELNFLCSKTKSASVCAPTDTVTPPSPGRKGWSAGAHELPEQAFRFSKKMPPTGFDGDSQELLRSALKEARSASDFKYAKIGQCNEDQLAKRSRDGLTYPPHIYDGSGIVVLMYGILGLPDGRFFESTGAKTNGKLQDVRLNEQLEPIEMANGRCAGTLDRPIAIYMMPVKEEYDDRPTALKEDAASHIRAINDSKRKAPADRQQEGETDETHDLRLKLLRSERCAQSNIDAPRLPCLKAGAETEADTAVAKPERKTPTQSMALFDGKKNKLLPGWSKTPCSTEPRAKIEAGYLIDALKGQLGDAKATERLNAITGQYAYHTVLKKLSKPDSGLTGFPLYNESTKAAALQQAVKDRWLCKPPALKSSAHNFFRSA